MKKTNYYLIDSGGQRKLEQFGPYLIDRPCSQALWQASSSKLWKSADLRLERAEKSQWQGKIPKAWQIQHKGLFFELEPTDFGHLGIFPEHFLHWDWIEERIDPQKEQIALNLFAYTGALSVYMASRGLRVCHVDASKPVIEWSKKNQRINGLEKAPIRYILDDALKFVKRELRRGNTYDLIALDPPSFGRGPKGEVFKIEDQVFDLLSSCQELLSKNASGLLFTCHSPGFSPLQAKNLFEQIFKNRKGQIQAAELALPSLNACGLPSGIYARWQPC